MGFQGFDGFAPLRQPQTMNLGLNEYGMDEEDPFNSQPQPTFRGPSPIDPMQNAQMPDAGFPQIPTQNSVFESQTGPNKIHPATSDAYNRLKSIFDSYTPDTRATDRYNNLLDNMPQVNDPGILRRIAGAGAAMGNVDNHFRRTGGGQEAADKVKYAPFINEMGIWKEKTAPFLSAATNENSRNIQERTLLSNLLSAQAQSDRQEELARQADMKNVTANTKIENEKKIAETKADNERQRIELLRAVQLGAKFEKVNGHIVATYPNGTVVDHGEYTDNTAIRIQEMKGTQQNAVQSAITNRVNNKPPKTPTPNETKQNRINAAVKILAEHPELGDYIKITDKGEVRMTKPTPALGGMFGQVDPALMDKYNKAQADIFKDVQIATPGAGLVPNTTPNPNGPVTTPQFPGRDKDPYTYGKSKIDPKKITRTKDGGKTMEISYDGGVTWQSMSSAGGA